MTAYLRRAAHDWQALLAFFLVYIAVAIWLGPAWFFLLWYTSLCGYVIHTALKR